MVVLGLVLTTEKSAAFWGVPGWSWLSLAGPLFAVLRRCWCSCRIRRAAPRLAAISAAES
eukprot:10506234-Alexandrium_andersonii.AAC.1